MIHDPGFTSLTMAMQPGDRVGVFEVLEPLGAGGMGEVYRALDTRLKREVALKVLPDRHRFDAHRLARFEREARALASLNHPGIATLYGFEEADGVQALVMELIEGDTLADRIAMSVRSRGGGLPLAMATDIARQVAGALEAAHECGVVHRDLKPSNIKVRADGSVKVLDFGLATSVERHAMGDPGASTITVADRLGMAGTPPYMSPEQARGDHVDRRTDVWAFGCVLYEMLTGRRAFEGRTTTDVLAHVIERDPDFDALPVGTPPATRRLLRRALTKDVRDRLHDIGDARLDLIEADARGLEAPAARAAVFGASARILSLGAVAVLIAVAVAAWEAVRGPSAQPGRVSRFEVRPPASAPLRDGGDQTRLFALSPDGTRLAYLTTRGLALRALDDLAVDVREVQGFGAMPFFSPDGRWIAGLGDGLRKVAVAGGPVVRLADTGPGAVGAWGDSGIVFADARGLFRVPDEGGPPEPLPVGTLGGSEQVTFPEPLPGGNAVLFTVMSTRSNTLGNSSVSSSARIEALDLRTGQRKVVLQGGGRPRYLPTGHLVYASGESLFVVRFDAKRLEVTGDAMRLSEGTPEFAVSNDGTLVYATGLDTNRRELVWVDRHGQEEPLGAPLAAYVYPRLSPDGSRVALDVGGPDRDVWIWDLSRRVMQRFTLDPTENVLPTWSLDGLRLFFASGRFGVPNIFVQSVDGSDQPVRVMESPRLQQPTSVARDGRLIFNEAVPDRSRDIVALSLDGSRTVAPLIHTPATEIAGEVSPDGRWIAYASDESGQFEVYVRPYPHVAGGLWKVSAGGGRQPLWVRNGRELLYRDFGGAVVAVPVVAGGAFALGPPVTVIPPGRTYAGYGSAIGGRTFDVSHDGSRFLMIKIHEAAAGPAFVVVQNWLGEIRSRQR